MLEFKIVSLILLAIVAMDSAGDAFRIHQWQIVHHIAEVVVVVAFFLLWALFDFDPLYPVMYITGRVWLFDPLLNVIAGYRLTYSGKSSLYGRILSAFQKRMKEPGHLVWVIRILALIWWTAWFATRIAGYN